jgi:uncharacterized protein YjeT (DUF2065 family)
MLHTLAFGGVLLVGLYLVGLAAAALLAPDRAARFLLGFAGTARAHYLELALRGLAGAAFVAHGPRMRFANAFVLAGWLLVVTTAGLALVPWRWHRTFAQRAVPYATRHLRWLGLASLLLAGVVLVALRAGAAERDVAAAKAAHAPPRGLALCGPPCS